MSIGPAIGAFLFEFGGFIMPFEVMGAIGFIIMLIFILVVPNVKPEPNAPVEKTLSFQDVIKVNYLWLN